MPLLRQDQYQEKGGGMPENALLAYESRVSSAQPSAN
jgi:hypothetical protein